MNTNRSRAARGNRGQRARGGRGSAGRPLITAAREAARFQEEGEETAPAAVRITTLDVARLAEVSEEDLAAMKILFDSWLATDFDISELSIFEYKGFEPESVWRHLRVKLGEIGRITPVQFRNEIAKLIGVQIMKGNITANNFGRMSQEAKDTTNMLLSKWGIVRKITPETRSTAVTLPRLSAAFPGIAAVMAGKVNKDYSGPFDSYKLPGIMKCSSFMGIVPTDFAGARMLLVASAMFTAEQTLVVSKPKNKLPVWTDEEKKTAYGAQSNYASIAWKSKALSPEERAVIFSRLAVDQVYDAVHSFCDPHKAITMYESISKQEWTVDCRKYSIAARTAVPAITDYLNDTLRMSDAYMAELARFDDRVQRNESTWDDADAPEAFYDRIILPEPAIEAEGTQEDPAIAGPSTAAGATVITTVASQQQPREADQPASPSTVPADVQASPAEEKAEPSNVVVVGSVIGGVSGGGDVRDSSDAGPSGKRPMEVKQREESGDKGKSVASEPASPKGHETKFQGLAAGVSERPKSMTKKNWDNYLVWSREQLGQT